MIRQRLCYLLLLSAGGFFVMLYNFQGLRFLFGCLVFIPFLSFLLLFPIRFCCKVHLEADGETAMRGEPLRIKVVAENRGLLPVPGLLLELCWNMPGEREKKIKKRLYGIGMKEKEIFLPEVSAMHCGQASLALSGTKVCDYFGIYTLPVGKKERAEVCIIPAVLPIPPAVEEACSRILQGNGGEREGDMLLRDFQPGDSLHRIYWKMAAKEDTLQVRDFERGSSVRLFLHYTEELKAQADAWDRYLDRAASFLYFCAEDCGLGISVEVIWRQGDACLRYGIPDGGAVQTFSCILLRQEEAGTVLSEEEITFLNQGWHLEEDCGLYFGEQCVYGME